MAIFLASKAPSAVLRYSWEPSLVAGDGLASAVLTVSSGTAVIDSYEIRGGFVLAYISGGVDGETTTIAASAVSNDDETLVDTIYLPIRPVDNAFTTTVLDVCNFALRKVVGIGETAEADEIDDAQERLNDMLAAWAASGADLGVKLPVTGSDVLYVPDGDIQALKYNLLIALADEYGEPISQVAALNARTGLQRIKNRLLPDEREGADYY